MHVVGERQKKFVGHNFCQICVPNSFPFLSLDVVGGPCFRHDWHCAFIDGLVAPFIFFSPFWGVDGQSKRLWLRLPSSTIADIAPIRSDPQVHTSGGNDACGLDGRVLAHGGQFSG